MYREEENGEDATCARRKRMGKMPPVQGGREWGRCHLCREEENGEDATGAGRKKMGRCHMYREEENGEDATCAETKSCVLLKRRERQK